MKERGRRMGSWGGRTRERGEWGGVDEEEREGWIERRGKSL